MSATYVHVGRHADILSSCRHVGPGDRVNEEDLSDEDRHLVAEGRLVAEASFGDGPSNAAQVQRDEPPAPAPPTLTAVPAAAPPVLAPVNQEGDSDDRNS